MTDHVSTPALLTDPDVIAGRTVDGEPVVAIGARSGLHYANIVPRWAEDLEALELASYPTADPEDLYNRIELRALATDFGVGCFAGFDVEPEGGDGAADDTPGPKLVSMGLGLRTQFDLDNPQHTIHDIMGHTPEDSGDDPDGRWYYGTGISTRIEYRRRGIGREVYALRKQVCHDLGLLGIVAGGVMPGYARHIDTMSADEYIDAVRRGDLYDPTLSFQAENGFELGPALPNYITDPAVNNYAALIVWHNPAAAT
ncbi:MAG: GNAT family N-acetyltransferase [Acidimicrobiia bacterium]|nr:GNAT family N-acetyltransferase [Acidimicrobiia bacterium]